MLSLYGTRDEAISLGYEMNDTMTKAGFVNGSVSVCIYRHRDKNVVAAVHGDDVAMEGEETYVRMEKYELNMQMIGVAPH